MYRSVSGFHLAGFEGVGWGEVGREWGGEGVEVEVGCRGGLRDLHVMYLHGFAQLRVRMTDSCNILIYLCTCMPQGSTCRMECRGWGFVQG